MNIPPLTEEHVIDKVAHIRQAGESRIGAGWGLGWLTCPLDVARKVDIVQFLSLQLEATHEVCAALLALVVALTTPNPTHSSRQQHWTH